MNESVKHRINVGKIIEVVVLITLPLSLFVLAYFKIQQAALLSMLVAILASVPFFINFERSRPKPRDILPIVVMAALATAGRLIFGPIPHFKPVSAIVIVTGITFGRRSGYVAGALTALASNMFIGQGPWTPWQMFSWGLTGYLAGVLEDRGWFKHRWFVYAYGFFSGVIFGLIMDSWHIVGFVSPLTLESALVAYGAGFFFNITHSFATVLFLVPILNPWTKKLTRVKRKFGLKDQAGY